MTRGLILFAHGARDPRWAAPFDDAAARIRAARPGLHVQPAYLDFMTPDLAGAVAQLAAQGCTLIDVMPMFLGSGGHVRKDLPQLLDGLRARHAGITLRLHTAIGELPAVLQAMAEATLACVDAAGDAA
ncbi:MAG: CbiX/SirB N-terminal domain-containing protein [Rubrivivax sp.]